MNINVDSDGVVYNMQTTLSERARLRWPENELITDEPHSWSVSAAWGIAPPLVRDLFETEARLGLFFDGAAYPGAIESVKALAKRHYVRVVTNKGAMNGSARDAMLDTVEWYDDRGLLPYIDLSFSRDSVKQEYVADIIVDDHPSLAWAQPYSLNLLMDRPWNRVGCKDAAWVDAETCVIRVRDWNDAMNHIREYEDGHLRGDHG